MSSEESTAAPETTPTAEVWSAIEDLPPSAKLVAKVLDYNGVLTQREIAAETLLPQRTVRYAISQLESAGVIASEISFQDARQKRYSLSIEDV